MFKGLTQAQVEESRKKYGPNTITEAEPDSFWKQFLEGFNDPMIRILCFIAVVMLAMFAFGQTEWYEPVGTIIAVLLVNFVSAKTGVANDDAYAKLKASQKKETAKVIRDGEVCIIEVDDIVVGDIIVLQSGDKILADGILLEGKISVDNSALNGEAEECKKTPAEKGFRIPDDITGDTFVDASSLFRGATVLDGEGYMEIQKVGMSTMMGKMAEDMAGDDPDSPLKVKLSHLAKQISTFGYIGASLIAIVTLISYVVNAGGFAEFMTLGVLPIVKLVMEAISVAITIIVCAVPEGLPLVIALVLMQNTGKLLKHNVLVRKSEGIETAGSLNILFSDKTGTITKGHLEVTEFFTGDGNTLELKDSKVIKEDLILCIAKNTGAMFDKTHTVVGGNMTDKALLNFLGEEDYNSVSSIKVDDVQDFNSANKFSQSFVKGKTVYKGAPERLLAKAKKYVDKDGKIKDLDLDALNKKIDDLANRAMRVLAFGYSESEMVRDEINDDVILVGLVAIRDDVRPEARDAIADVQNAGIQVVMITGDRLETAVAIAKDANLLGDNTVILTMENKDELIAKYKSTTTSAERGGIALTSSTLAELTDDEIKSLVSGIRVIARALPTDKSRMVKVCQSMNLVVGMTGDGVNDAPALKRADIGFAMGSGTAVAKEAGDLVILDDNFKSIKDAIWFGRTIYINILKFCKMQLVINVGAVIISMLCPILGIEEPLKVTHLLWINLVMDSLASIMMAGEPALDKYMKAAPRKRDEAIISKPLAIQIGFMAVWLTILGVLYFELPMIRACFDTEAQWYTGYFCLFIFAAMMNALNIRSDGFNLFSHIKENPTYLKIWVVIIAVQVLLAMSSLIPGIGVVANMFSCSAFGLNGWLVVFLMSATMIPVDMIRKLIFKTYKEN